MNKYVLLALIIRFVTLLILLRYMLVGAIKEIRRPKNEFNYIRRRLLIIVLITFVLLAPGLWWMLEVGETSEICTSLDSASVKWSLIGTNLAILAFVIAFAQIYQYRPKINEGE